MTVAPAGRRPRTRLAAWAHRWGMLVLVLASLGWLWGLSLWSAEQQKQQLLADRSAELALMATAVSQHTAGMLRAVESDLRMLDVWLFTHPEADVLNDPRFMLLLDGMRRAWGGLIDPRIVAADGSLYLLPCVDAHPLANVSDREYFKLTMSAQGDDARKVVIGTPVLSRVTQRWLLPVTLRISPAPAGSRRAGLAGPSTDMRVLYAAIELERLSAEHETMRFQPNGTIMLVRSDGVTLSRVPALPAMIGRDLSGTPHYVGDYGRSPQGSFVSKGEQTDGVARLVNYQRLAAFPVTVLVSRELEDIYTSYYRRMRTTLVLSGVLSFFVLTVAFFLHKAYRRRDEMQSAQDHLHRLATTDELTGVLNRRAFMDGARREFERAKRFRRPTAVLALDIDHFKKVNDDYGHAGGDLVLQVCAARWQAGLREQDMLGRIGGEEFCVLLPETSGAAAARVAERLRAVTSASPILGNSRSVSVSIGWTTLDNDDADWPRLLARADQALYKAKQQGRDRVHPPSDANVGEVPDSETVDGLKHAEGVERVA